MSKYALILGARGGKLWVLLLISQRLTVAMFPINLVLLMGELSKPWLGGLLVGVSAIAEAVFAPALGRRFDSRNPGREMALVTSISALITVLIAVSVDNMSTFVLVLFVVLATGLPAGAHGGLRTMALRLFSDSPKPALALENSLSTAAWMVGPVLVAAVSALSSARISLVLVGGLLIVGGLAVFLPVTPDIARTVRESSHPVDSCSRVDAYSSKGRFALLVLPSCLQSAAAMLVVGGLTVTLVPMLSGIGASEHLSGVFLGIMAAAGIVSSLAYGLRSEPARVPVMASVAFVSAMSLMIGGVSFVSSVVGIGVFVVLAGALDAPSNTVRAYVIQRIVPAGQLSSAYSTTYAFAGLGFGAAGLLQSGLSAFFTASELLRLLCAIALVLTISSGVVEKRLVDKLIPSRE
jgi:MFS family permease